MHCHRVVVESKTCKRRIERSKHVLVIFLHFNVTFTVTLTTTTTATAVITMTAICIAIIAIFSADRFCCLCHWHCFKSPFAAVSSVYYFLTGGSHRVCLLEGEAALSETIFRPSGDVVHVWNGIMWYCGRTNMQIKRHGKQLSLNWAKFDLYCATNILH